MIVLYLHFIPLIKSWTDIIVNPHDKSLRQMWVTFSQDETEIQRISVLAENPKAGLWQRQDLNPFLPRLVCISFAAAVGSVGAAG